MSKARDLANAGTALTTVSATELGYLDGVTSAVQTQIDSKIGQSTAINPTIVDAKGDIIAATAADTVARLAVGANDTVLTADSTAATGLKWATPSAGGMTLISETVASAATGISFSSIPSTYKQLLLVWSGVEHSATGSTFTLRINNNSGSVYAENYFYFSPSISTVSSGVGTSIAGNAGFPSFGENTNSAGTLQHSSSGHFLLDNYASSTKLKAFNTRLSYRQIASPYNFHYVSHGVFNSTSAVTSLDIVRLSGTATLSNITNTTIRLYGVS